MMVSAYAEATRLRAVVASWNIVQTFSEGDLKFILTTYEQGFFYRRDAEIAEKTLCITLRLRDLSSSCGTAVGSLLQARNIFSADFEPQSHFVALFKMFRFLDSHFDGHKIASVLGEQGGGELGFADPYVDRDHPPAVGHEARDRFDVAACFRRNGDEKIWGRTAPVKNFSAELDDHG